MKKQVIVILSLVLLVAITLGAYLFVRNNNQEKQKKESEDAAAKALLGTIPKQRSTAIIIDRSLFRYFFMKFSFRIK